MLKNLENCPITIIWCKDFNGHLNCPNRERYLGSCEVSVAKLFAKIVKKGMIVNRYEVPWL